MINVDLALEGTALLGESPVWDPGRQCLFWVDGRGERINSFDPLARTNRSMATASWVGSLAVRSGGGLLAALDGRVSSLDWETGTFTEIAQLEERGEIRFNDGTCDTRGRFLVGTRDPSADPGSQGIYRVDSGSNLTKVLGGLTIPNGMGWSPDDSWFYLVDSASRTIARYQHDTSTGTLGKGDELIEIPPDQGIPDGMAVDTEGFLWVALMGAGAVQRYSPQGKLDEVVRLPVRGVTNCAFGGADLDVLYVTSGRWRRTETDLEAEPLHGSIFSCRPGVRGLTTPFFAD